jgi:uncharacterized protein (DUF302 family)
MKRRSQMENLGFTIKLSKTYAEAIDAVTKALKTEGFGILTEIDVKGTLKSKLDLSFRPFAILGACNPQLAHKALNQVPEIGLLLPCNITVEEKSKNESIVRILDPKIMLSIGNLECNEIIMEVASEAHDKLSRVRDLLDQV